MNRRNFVVGCTAFVTILNTAGFPYLQATTTGLPSPVYTTDRATDILLVLRDQVRPGFDVYSAGFVHEPMKDEVWFKFQFSYCGRYKYCSVHTDTLESPHFIQALVDQIEITPVLDSIEEHPDHYATVVRCLKRNPAYGGIA